MGFDYRTSTGLGRQTIIGGHKQSLVCTRTQRQEQWPHKRLARICLWVSRNLGWRLRSVVACCRVWGTECGSAVHGTFWRRSPLSSLPVPFLWILNCEVPQSCPTLCDAMDCSLPGSSVHGIFQVRILEWVTISFSRGSSQPRHQTWVSCIAGRHFTIWAIRETLYHSLFSGQITGREHSPALVIIKRKLD